MDPEERPVAEGQARAGDPAAGCHADEAPLTDAPSLSVAVALSSLGVAERPLEAALALGPALLRAAQKEGAPWIAASLSSGPAVVLGAAQRAGRVVDLDACARAGARVLRRATTGTAAYVGGRAVVWTLALPAVSSLMRDASPRTLLNRNVRGFLRGFRSAGAAAHYFGREWIALKQRPGPLLGFDISARGEVLLEVIAGYDEPIAIPAGLSTPAEREVERWQGKSPAALADVLPAGRTPADIAEVVIESVAAQASARLRLARLEQGEAERAEAASVSELDPIPEGLVPAPPRRVPIGWIEAAASPAGGAEPRRAWVGGDMLTSVWALAEIAQAAASGEERLGSAFDGQIALEGALLNDVEGALRDALRL
jgi:hypothetical protein